MVCFYGRMISASTQLPDFYVNLQGQTSVSVRVCRWHTKRDGTEAVPYGIAVGFGFIEGNVGVGDPDNPSDHRSELLYVYTHRDVESPSPTAFPP